MSHGTDFNEAAARRLEAVYQTPDVVAQRLAVLKALALRPGERALDIGVGPGLLAYELAAIVGANGSFTGIDTAAPMLEMSRRRCANLPQARFELADAASLPLADGCIDAAVSTQVYEYVPDLGTAFAELASVLAPGGRAVILDTDYDSFVLAADDKALAARVLGAWDEHFVHRDLPRRLAPLLRAAGLKVEAVEAIPMLSTEYHAHAFAYGMVHMMGRFAAGRRGITETEAKAFLDEMERLGDEGRFFYSLNRYLFVARKPG